MIPILDQDNEKFKDLHWGKLVEKGFVGKDDLFLGGWDLITGGSHHMILTSNSLEGEWKIQTFKYWKDGLILTDELTSENEITVKAGRIFVDGKEFGLTDEESNEGSIVIFQR